MPSQVLASLTERFGSFAFRSHQAINDLPFSPGTPSAETFLLQSRGSPEAFVHDSRRYV